MVERISCVAIPEGVDLTPDTLYEPDAGRAHTYRLGGVTAGALGTGSFFIVGYAALTPLRFFSVDYNQRRDGKPPEMGSY